MDEQRVIDAFDLDIRVVGDLVMDCRVTILDLADADDGQFTAEWPFTAAIECRVGGELVDADELFTEKFADDMRDQAEAEYAARRKLESEERAYDSEERAYDNEEWVIWVSISNC